MPSGLPVADVIETVFARIAAADDPGIFIHLAEQGGAARAKPRRSAHSIPWQSRSGACRSRSRTTSTSPACRPRPPAPEYAYLPGEGRHRRGACSKAAGALVVGKTNLDQFATGLVGVRTPYPIPRNAIDPKLVPGGSSSGSAVATARGIVSFALGTDTAGSGRIPAGLNNIVGLKPTVGALSAAGVVPACRTLDCVSDLRADRR